MDVGIRIKLAEATHDQFGAVNDCVHGADDPPRGLLSHSSGPMEGGRGVLDFWESPEPFDTFYGSRVRDAIAAEGTELAGPPDLKEAAAHEYVRP